MKKSEELTIVVKELRDLMDDLRVVSYEANNKLHNPMYFYYIKEAQEKGLETSIAVLTGHVKTLNAELGNPDITDIYEFTRNYLETA